MTITALDENFQELGQIKDVQELAWERLYHSKGAYTMLVKPFEEYARTKYLYVDNDVELAIVHGAKYSTTSNMIILSGLFSEHLLDNDIIYPTYKNTTAMTRYDIAKDIVTKYTRLPNVEVISTVSDNPEKIYLQETGMEVGKKLYEILYTEGASYRLLFDFDNNKFIFKTVKGVDRTESQTANPAYTFEVSRKNLDTFEYTKDDTNYKNTAIVEGVDGREGREEVRIMQTVSIAQAGETIQEIYVDARDLTYDGEITLDEFKQSLATKGYETLLDYTVIETITFTSTPVGYKENYDLGDKVSVKVVDDFLSIYMEARIIGIKELYTGGAMTLQISCGDLVPTEFDKTKMKGK